MMKRQYLSSSIKKQKGVAAIEFAMGFFFFWLMCAVWVEMSFLSYVSAIGDLAISQVALHSKRVSSEWSSANDVFLADFESVIDNSDSLWRYVVDSDDFSYSIRYVASYEKLVDEDDTCEVTDTSESNSTTCGNASNAAIAIYRIQYDASPIFNYFLDSNTLFSREAIVIQEYQREKFAL
ncbi:TadE/TadG family type IV pilus assembly protein [Vibrio porteresiae]|uniref:Pilus assembly protein n=1 Tax=Vibrio porteresiae DSM 19223 TaxID=1123496 RepID=A0ABZ0QIW7_9VIBR|nr:pilus assembly protein [Vibrio porteresiae]WPC76448.1 pilus assembly protein [Vibrio porteresiae DSM 19223]